VITINEMSMITSENDVLQWRNELQRSISTVASAKQQLSPD
jgi:hypothetical protein